VLSTVSTFFNSYFLVYGSLAAFFGPLVIMVVTFALRTSLTHTLTYLLTYYDSWSSRTRWRSDCCRAARFSSSSAPSRAACGAASHGTGAPQPVNVNINRDF